MGQTFSELLLNVELLTGKDAFDDRHRWVRSIQDRAAEKGLPTDIEFLKKMIHIVKIRWSGICSEGARDTYFIMAMCSLWEFYREREEVTEVGAG